MIGRNTSFTVPEGGALGIGGGGGGGGGNFMTGRGASKLLAVATTFLAIGFLCHITLRCRFRKCENYIRSVSRHQFQVPRIRCNWQRYPGMQTSQGALPLRHAADFQRFSSAPISIRPGHKLSGKTPVVF